MLSNIQNMLADEEGATMVEYGLIVALIAAACIAIVTTFGQTLTATFAGVNKSLQTANKNG